MNNLSNFRLDSNVILQLATILGLSAIFALICQRFKLPIIVAYLLAGVVISLAHLSSSDTNVLNILPNIGIAFVLFLIGMELDLREIRSLGKPIIISSLMQILISSVAGFAIAGWFGLPQTESILIGIGLSFSSTVVVIKLLSEKKDLESLYGKLSVGILLIEDLVAIIVLMAISLNRSAFDLGFYNNPFLLVLLVKTVLLFGLTYLISRYVLNRVFRYVAKSLELLFLVSLTWCFLFTSLVMLAGFSTVIGAFLAGVALASSPYDLQIQGKIKPLRDFFLSLFFVYLGSQVSLVGIVPKLPLIFSLAAYAIIAKPLIFLLILGIFGFRKHTIFETSLNLSQISEFSLVILLVGISSLGVAPIDLSVMAMVGVVSIIISSIMITYSKPLYRLFSPFISFFEHQSNVHYMENHVFDRLEDHVVLIGAHRVGGAVVDYLAKTKIPFVVLEFNPRIVEKLAKQGVSVVYGDAADSEILNSLYLDSARLIISTASDFEDTESLLKECRRLKVHSQIIVRSTDLEDVKILKDLGADYVIMPEIVSGDFLVDKIRTHWLKT